MRGLGVELPFIRSKSSKIRSLTIWFSNILMFDIRKCEPKQLLTDLLTLSLIQLGI